MVRKVTKNNYRNYYKQYYNIEFGSEMDIHHIDKNRNNNDIRNLILFPGKFHNLYHSYGEKLELYGEKCSHIDALIYNVIYYSFNTDKVKTLCDSFKYWADLKWYADTDIKLGNPIFYYQDAITKYEEEFNIKK